MELTENITQDDFLLMIGQLQANLMITRSDCSKLKARNEELEAENKLLKDALNSNKKLEEK